MRNRLKTGLSLAPLGVAFLLAFGCSTDSPTAPVQEPIPPSGGTASAVWRITIDADPAELTVGADNPTTITIRVRQADTNQPPQTGTTVVVSTSLGEFSAAGSGTQSLALSTAAGRTSVLLFAGDVVGTAFVTAQLESSVGQVALPIREVLEPVVASFTEQNSNENLSWQFLNTSTGSPTRFRWDFGDGGTSRDENPHHLYAEPGDYVVTLTASKPGSSDTASKILSVSENPEEVVAADFEYVIEDRTVVFRDASTGNPTSWFWTFGDGTSSSEQNPTHVFPQGGSYVVTLTAANRRTEDTVSQIVTVSEDEFFITDVSPKSGPFSGGTTVTITGVGFREPLRVFFGGVLATTLSVEADGTKIFVITPPFDSSSEEGGSNGCEAVNVRVELSTGEVGEVQGGFVYIRPGATCD